jgi:hypothetical protein
MKRKNEPVAVSEARPPARSESVIVAPEENPEESKATAEESSGIHQATPKVETPLEESKTSAGVVSRISD